MGCRCRCQNDSCMGVHGDEEGLVEYDRMSRDITWSGEEPRRISQNLLSGGCHMDEEEGMIDRVVVDYNCGTSKPLPPFQVQNSRKNHGRGTNPV